MKAHKYIAAVLVIKKAQKEYRELNKRIAKAHGCDDLPPRFEIMTFNIEEAVISALDDALEHLTGFCELASYYLYEEMDRYEIFTPEGKSYSWTNDKEYEYVIYKRIKENDNGTNIGYEQKER